MPGTQTRNLSEVREMVRVALEKAGGAEYLLEQAREQPVAFLSLLARLIPAEIRASLESNSLLTVRVRSYTGLAWQNEAQRLASEARVAAIEPELEPRDDLRTVVLKRRQANPAELPATTAVAPESEGPD